VFVVQPDGTAELRLVSLGQRQGDAVVIKQGVGAGEAVILTGQMTVNPGGKVRVATSAPGASGGSQAVSGEGGA
jgi:membrane fusion protein (multidrug efflux system)